MFPEAPPSDQAQLQIGDKIHADHGKHLGIKHLKYPKVSYLEASVDLIKEIEHQHVQTDHDLISTVKPPADHIFMGIKFIPDVSKKQSLNGYDQCRCKKHDNSFVSFPIFHFSSHKRILFL